MRELSAIYLTGWARIEPSQLLQKTMFDRKTNGKTCALPVFLLLAHVAGVGTVDNLSGRLIDEVNSDVLYLGAIENIVHSTVHVECQNGEGLCQI